MQKSYIYRYTDIITEEVVYVGIVYAGHSLRTRINKELKTWENQITNIINQIKKM